MDSAFYHLGFGKSVLGGSVPEIALLSGDPGRAKHIADSYFQSASTLSEHRGLNSYVGEVGDKRVLSCTSGMGAPSLSIVVNELVQLGVQKIIRIGTSGSIQDHVRVGDVVVSIGSFCNQGAAEDIAPTQFPAVGDPWISTGLMEAANELELRAHAGVTGSMDTFYEGQERTDSANPNLLRSKIGLIDELRNLGVLNLEMEAGTLFKMGSVYGFQAGCVCAIVAERRSERASEDVVLDAKGDAVENAIRVAIEYLKK